MSKFDIWYYIISNFNKHILKSLEDKINFTLLYNELFIYLFRPHYTSLSLRLSYGLKVSDATCLTHINLL